MDSTIEIIDLTRNKPRSVPPEPDLLPPCRVCREKASGFHYGVNTCHSCKGFFSRSLDRNEEYVCQSGDKKCAILRKFEIKTCPLCRYQRCLEVGMSKKAIRAGRYTHTVRTRNLQEARGLVIVVGPSPLNTLETPTITAQHISPVSSKSSSPDSEESGLGLPSDRLLMLDSNPVPSSSYKKSLSTKAPFGRHEELEFERAINNISDSHRKFSDNIRLIENGEELQAQQSRAYEIVKLKESMFGELQPISRAEYRDFFRTTGIDIDDRHTTARKVMEYMQQHLFAQVQFAKGIKGFKDLHLEDQCRLLKGSFYEVSIFDSHGTYNSDLDIKVFGRLAIQPREICYFDNYKLMAQRTEFEKSLKDMHLNFTETALIKAIILLFSDRVPLDMPADVDNLQLKVIHAFQHYLRKTNPNFKKRFATIWNKIIQARTVSLQHDEVRRSCIMDFPEIQDFPLFYEAWKE